MRQLTDESARAILTDPLINLSELARQYYQPDAEDPAAATYVPPDRPDVALRKVTLDRPPGKITAKTLTRLTVVLCGLYEKMSDEVFL